MARRDLLTEAEREQLFAVPVDRAGLARFYTLAADDIERIQARRSDAHRLGFAVQIALLRHPGFGWRAEAAAPTGLIEYLAEQLGLPPGTSPAYSRRQTRLEHGWEAAAHVGLRPAAPADVSVAIGRATEAARETDRGLPIASAIVKGMHTDRVILVAPARIERIAIAGRARARRLAADTVLAALTADQVAALDRLLVVDAKSGVTPLAWLRDIGDSPSAKNISGRLDRLAAVRRIGIPARIGELIHARRFRQLVREAAVAPAFLLSDYSLRRRRATLAATVIDLEARLADSAIEMFDKQTGALFAKARAAQKRGYEATTRDVGRLMRLFGTTIGSLKLARKEGLDVFSALDDDVGWDKLLRAAPQVAAIADLAQEDPLVRAAGRYMTLRRYAPAFLDAFELRAAGTTNGALAAVKLLRQLNATGKRDVPADAPMPFSRKWQAAIREGGTIDRRRYETATIALVRDRLRSGDLWVDGTRNYQRFDSYFLPQGDVPAAIVGLPVDTDADTYIAERMRTLDWRLKKFALALKRGTIEGVDLRGGELHVAPIVASTPAKADRIDSAVDQLMPQVRITELFAEVAARTGFHERFSELRSGRSHPHPEALLAAVLADATNLGIERMAHSSQGVTYAQLAWTHGWYLSEENYAAGLACIIDAQAALPLARVWVTAQRLRPTGSSSGSGAAAPPARSTPNTVMNLARRSTPSPPTDMARSIID